MRRALLLAAALWASAASGGTRPRQGGELRVAVASVPVNVDPALAISAAEVTAARLAFDGLVSMGADGALAPALASAVPAPEADGRSFRIRLRPDLRFQSGAPVTARDVADSLSRLADAALDSPHAAIALPVLGAREGGVMGRRLPGVSPSSEAELVVTLAFAYPDWPRALAHPAAAIADLRGGRPVGSGPFAPGEAGARWTAFRESPGGRPFVDALRWVSSDARAIARALATGDADAALGSSDRGALEGPALFATHLAFNARRVEADLRASVEAVLDVAGVARTFVRPLAAPMYGLLPPALDPSSAVARPRSPAPPPANPGRPLVLVADAGADDQRAVADRIQVKMHDLGVALQVRRLSRADLRRALKDGEWDLAMVAVASIPEAGMALAQLVHLTQGADAAREVLKGIGAGGDPAARRALALERAASLLGKLPLLPLYAQSPRLAARVGVVPGGFDGAGAALLADTWIFEGRRPPARPGP